MRKQDMVVGKWYDWREKDIRVWFDRFTENYLCIVNDGDGVSYAVPPQQLEEIEQSMNDLPRPYDADARKLLLIVGFVVLLFTVLCAITGIG